MRKKKYILVLLLSVFFGSTVPIFLEYFTSYIDNAWTVNGYRYIVVFIIMFPIVIKMIRDKKYTKKMWKVALIPASFNFAQQVMWAWAPYYIDPSLMGFLLKSIVIWSILGSFILFTDERDLLRSIKFWIGLTTAIIGTIGLSYFGGKMSASGTFLGVVLVLGSSLFMASYGLTVKKYFNDTNSIVSFSIISFYTAIGIISLMFVMGKPATVFELPTKVVLLIAVSALVGITLGHILFYSSLKYVGVVINYSVGLLSAFFTAIMSYLFYDDKLTLFQWLAGTLILIGGFITIIAKKNVVLKNRSDQQIK